jgi:hypothetical protein
MKEVDEKPTCPKCDAELSRSDETPGKMICMTPDCGFHLQMVPGYSLMKLKRIL